MRTVPAFDGSDIAALVAKARAAGMIEEQRAKLCAALDDFAVSSGSGQQELDALLREVPRDSCHLLAWVVAHPKISIESEAPDSLPDPPPRQGGEAHLRGL
jgi:hypothetical protein